MHSDVWIKTWQQEIAVLKHLSVSRYSPRGHRNCHVKLRRSAPREEVMPPAENALSRNDWTYISTSMLFRWVDLTANLRYILMFKKVYGIFDETSIEIEVNLL